MSARREIARVAARWLAIALLLLPAAGVAQAAGGHGRPDVGPQDRAALLAGVVRAVAYSGFRNGQHPDRGAGAVNPTDAEVLEDLELLESRGFRLIRLYDSLDDSSTVLRLIERRHLRLKVLLGAWLEAELNNPDCPWKPRPYSERELAEHRSDNRREIERAIRLANRYRDVVVAVAVGNEALVDWSDHRVPVESVLQYVRRVKRHVAQPVTVADNYAWWVQHGARLARELDFVSLHTYPIWEGRDVDQAMALTMANVEAVREALPASRVVITEAGWATAGTEFGARADERRQREYFQDLFRWAEETNVTTFWFEAFDERWKGDPSDPAGAEKHWGLFTEDRQPKQALRD